MPKTRLVTCGLVASLWGCAGGTAKSPGPSHGPDAQTAADAGGAAEVSASQPDTRDAVAAPTDTRPPDGGAPGEIPHVVANCAHLPAPGTWEEISPIPGNAPKCANCQPGEGSKWGAVNVVAHPNISGTLYSAVWNGGIWKSTDCGATWAKVNTGTEAATLDSGVQFVLRLDAAGATDTLYSENWLGTNVGFFKSTNGRDFKSLYDGNSVVAKDVELGGWGNDLRFDPDDRQHLLINFHANCTAPYDAVCVGESKDGGATWRLVNGPPQLTVWPEGSSVFFVTATTWLFGSHAGLFYTPDAGGTWNQVAQSATGTMIQSPNGSYYLTSDQGLLQSRDRKAWSLVSGGPGVGALVETGKTLYAGNLSTVGSISSAAEDNPTTWTTIPMPTTAVNGGAWVLDYDADHHVLYSANNHSGLWRMVTE